ncbi:MAG: hypothetical protein BGO70_13240 [Bacteroidetes bacterium 43-93]|nr:hypothetical protein [Bacteroidota bacterium]OJW99402.1 MAG: hypothetical protein BGO70_13240 [Bacteroidetes bacterium 43-93]
MKQYRSYIVIPLLVLLCIATRLPMLCSPNRMLDIDECTVGLMADHQYYKGEISPIFWGQAYGFTLVETTAITAIYAIGGVSDISVKIAMLVLWIIGIVFFYKTLNLVSKERVIPLLITLLFICSPAWAVWSMKARGGYLTAFTLGWILLYLVMHPAASRRIITWVLAGALISLIYESQALWIPGLLPIIIYRLVKEKKRRFTASFIITALCSFGAFAIYKEQLTVRHYVVYAEQGDLLQNVLRIPAYLYAHLHGDYFFDYIAAPNAVNASFAILFSILAYGLILIAIFYSLKKRNSLFVSSALGILLSLLATIPSLKMEPRYMLPVTGCTLLTLQLFLNNLTRLRAAKTSLAVVCITGLTGLLTLHDYSFCKTKRQELLQLISYLEEGNIHHVYVPDWMLQWQIMYYSHEQVIARQQEIPDRCPVYNKSVDKAFYTGKPVAIVGYDGSLNLPGEQAHIAGYFVYAHPSKELLQQNFTLWPISSYYK